MLKKQQHYLHLHTSPWVCIMIFLSPSPWVCVFCYSCLCVYLCVRVQNVWTSKRYVQLSIQWAQQGVRALWPDSPTLWLSGFISDPQIMSSCCAVGTMYQHFKNHINYLSCLCATSENKVNIKTADMNRSCDGASSELWSIIPFFFDDRQNDGTLMGKVSRLRIMKLWNKNPIQRKCLVFML